MLFLLLASAAYLALPLAHGASLGPYDILSTYGLTAHTHATVHNLVGSDEIEEFIPWNVLAWRQVHSGHLPLWNPDSLLGLPLAFNFQSAPFSFSVALSYLFPLRLAHSAAVAARLVVGGLGAYVLCRVLALSPLASAFAGAVFELSGAFSIWLGSYEAGCYALLGWILAASVLLVRGEHRLRWIALLAIALALAFYAGEPQIALLVVATLVLVAGIRLLGLGRRTSWRAMWRGVLDHLLALVLAALLAMPIYLPGAQLAAGSARSTGPFISGLPLYDLSHLLFSTYDGSPSALSRIIGPDNLYVSMLYVGVIPVVLALVALKDLRRRIDVVAFFALLAVVLVALFFSPVVDVALKIPDLDVFRLLLSTTLVDFALAVLAAFGAEALLDHREAASARSWLVAASVLVAAVLLALGVLLVANVEHLSNTDTTERAASFVWPVACLCACGVALCWQPVLRRWSGARSRARAAVGPCGVALLLLVATGFLADAGTGIWSSTAEPFPKTPTLSALQRDVGSGLVAMGSCARNAFSPTGIIPEDNLAYGIEELTAFDPIVPAAYSRSYGRATSTTTKVGSPPALFCAAITSVALAHRYGVAYVLEPPGAKGPVGMRKVATLAGEGLYGVPGSSRAVLVPLHGAASASPRSAQQVTQPSPSSWRIVTDATRASVLHLAITDVPGWNASIDGRPLQLERWNGVELEATIPAGRRVITLSYWPRTFTIGLVLAGVALVAIVAGLVADAVASDRRRSCRRARPDAART